MLCSAISHTVRTALLMQISFTITLSIRSSPLCNSAREVRRFNWVQRNAPPQRRSLNSAELLSGDAGVLHGESGMPIAELLLSIVPGAPGTSELPTTTQWRLPSRQPPRASEAVAAQLAQDDMVKELNSEYFACLADAFGQTNIVLAG